MFSCSCIDTHIGTTICKHIHLVKLALSIDTLEEQITSPEDTSCLITPIEGSSISVDKSPVETSGIPVEASTIYPVHQLNCPVFQLKHLLF